MCDKKIKVGIIGATGYAGAELFRLLSAHRYAEVVAVSSTSFEGQTLDSVYPALNNGNHMVLCNMDEVVEKSDVVFYTRSLQCRNRKRRG